MEKEEPKQWNLTKDECQQLKDYRTRELGLAKILESLARLEGLRHREEGAWWEGVRLKHKIPDEYILKLLADWEAGKIWVKGEVSSLDNLPKFKPLR